VVWPYEIASRIRLVTPHLDRGIALLHRLNEQQGIADGLEAILARIQTAVLTVGPTLRLGFTNPAAEALLGLGDGLCVRNGRVTARWPEDQRRLAVAVSEACGSSLFATSSPTRTGAAGVLIPICRDDDQPRYRVSVFPLRRDHAVRGLTSEAEAVLFVDDPSDDAASAQIDLYSRAFRLTPAEARLAVHLASGASLTEAADAFGVTHNTVRAQLRAIFDKTETHRQSELVRLLQTSRSLRVSLS
jgi:DNA-binding CsgD family transcriptional regulator